MKTTTVNQTNSRHVTLRCFCVQLNYFAKQRWGRWASYLTPCSKNVPTAMDVGVDLEEVRPGGSGLIRIRGDDALSALIFPHASSSTGVRWHGADRAEAAPICISTNRSAPGSSRGSSPGQSSSTASSPILDGPSMVHRPVVSPVWFSLGDSPQEWPFVTGWGHNLSSPDGYVEVVGLTSEKVQPLNSGFSTEVVEAMLNSKSSLHGKTIRF